LWARRICRILQRMLCQLRIVILDAVTLDHEIPRSYRGRLDCLRFSTIPIRLRDGNAF
jgi:hypothetical protein